MLTSLRWSAPIPPDSSDAQAVDFADDRTVSAALASEGRRTRIRHRILVVVAFAVVGAGVVGSIAGIYLFGFGAVFLAVHLNLTSSTRRAQHAEWTRLDGEVTVGPGIGARRVVSVRLADGRRGELQRGHTSSPMGSYSGRLMVSEGLPQLVVIPGNSRIYRLVNVAS